MARRAPVGVAERDGNIHIHKGKQWVVGTYHDGWHPAGRTHKGITEEGRRVHGEHIQEIVEERKDKEQAILAKYHSLCSRCKKDIPADTPVWRHPTIKAVRHRGDGTCDVAARERDVPAAPAPREIDVQAKIDEATAGLHREVITVAARLHRAEAEVEQFRKTVAKLDAKRLIEVVSPKLPKPKKVGIQHKQFPKLLRLANARINIAMVGDAGSGKTTAPLGVAKALGLPFYHVPVGPQTSKSDLLGFINGAGKYVYSLLCEAYETGGVALLDEMDAANPATLTIANGMIEAVEAGFADRMRKRHPDCIFMAAMNTFGRGADMLFVGRAQLDAATLNRWYYLNWDTDWDLTRALVNDDKWVNYVESLYNSASRQKVRVTIGMRTAIMGKKAMLAGDTREEAEHGVIWAPIKPDDKQKILVGVNTSEVQHGATKTRVR